MSAVFFDVFNWLGLTWAAGSGVAIGATAVLWGVLRFPLKIALQTVRMSALVALGGVLLGSVFFAGQISQAYFTDPFWERALARYALWLVFSVSVGLGLGFAHSFAQRKHPKDQYPKDPE